LKRSFSDDISLLLFGEEGVVQVLIETEQHREMEMSAGKNVTFFGINFLLAVQGRYAKSAILEQVVSILRIIQMRFSNFCDILIEVGTCGRLDGDARYPRLYATKKIACEIRL
jgi:hypothetical protein